MDSDAAELSALTTVISDVAQRIAEMAMRHGADRDDPIAARLHEIERVLVTVERQLRSTTRDLG